MSDEIRRLLARGAGERAAAVNLERIRSGGRRFKVRRLVLATGTAVGLSAFGTAVIVTSSDVSPFRDQPGLAIDAAGSGDPSDIQPSVCPTSEGPGSYDPRLVPQSGPVGTVVTASGLVPQVEADELSGPPAALITLWWNLDYVHWPSVLPEVKGSPVGEKPSEPVIALGEFDNGANKCVWEIKFEVPKVDPGSWQVVALQHGRDRNEASMFAPATFDVTP